MEPEGLGGPVLLLSVARQTFDVDGQPNRFAWHDTGLSTAALMMQATALGMHVHAMGGFSRKKARGLFDIPEGYDPVAAIAMGYLGDPDSLAEDLREAEMAPRSRRPAETWAFAETWGRPFPLVECPPHASPAEGGSSARMRSIAS